jgi:hypothetical protein
MIKEQADSFRQTLVQMLTGLEGEEAANLREKYENWSISDTWVSGFMTRHNIRM